MNNLYEPTLTISKDAYLNSTAEGYDIVVITKSSGKVTRQRIYKNVHSFTMRRFYKLSGGWIDAHSTKKLTYSRIWAMQSEYRDMVLFGRSHA